jgi:RluA family pseudouridine synthase
MTKRKNTLRGITIVFEDKDLLVIDKPSGLLTVATDRDKVNNVFYLLMDYVRKGNHKSRNRVFIVHRLDRQTSGLIIFAKNEETQKALRANWSTTEKKYSVVVHGEPNPESGTIKSRLIENKAMKVYISDNEHKGILCQTDYKLVQSKKDYSLMDVSLVSGGFKHQIRVQLAHLGHPVVGDRKYGSKEAPSRMALHSREFSFDHPRTGKRMSFKRDLPASLQKLF